MGRAVMAQPGQTKPDAASVRDQYDRVIDAIAAKYPDAGPTSTTPATTCSPA